jgi:uncharacterized membrane protein YhaH (DUF805 family)
MARPMTSTAPTTPARRLRRYTSGAALILFPALLVVEGPLDPASGGTGEVMYRAAAEHAAALTASAVLLLVSGILMAPAAAAVLRQARDRGSALANIGAVLAVLGGFGHAGIAIFYLFSLGLAGGDRAEMVAYVDRVNESAALGFVAFPLILCFGLGVGVLAWAAWRSGSIGWWGPVVATVVVLAHVALPIDNAVIELAGLGALAVVFGWLGVRVLRMTDAEWEGAASLGTRREVMAA